MADFRTRLQNARAKFFRKVFTTTPASTTNVKDSTRDLSPAENGKIHHEFSVNSTPPNSATSTISNQTNAKNPGGNTIRQAQRTSAEARVTLKAPPPNPLVKSLGGERDFNTNSVNTAEQNQPQAVSEPRQPGTPAVPGELRGRMQNSLSNEPVSRNQREDSDDKFTPPPRDFSDDSSFPPDSEPDHIRRQSIVPHTQTRLITALLGGEPPSLAEFNDQTRNRQLAELKRDMVMRRIWVKRPGASATLVSVHEDDLVDDVRDMILRKYANSLGRSFDSPDVTIRIVSRDQKLRNGRDSERTLGPEEPIGRTLDEYYPGGQSVEEALVIDVPQRRTPKASPRNAQYMPYPLENELRPGESGSDYFPQMPVIPTPHMPALPPVSHNTLQPHSMTVLTTGQIPPLPSPGAVGRRHRLERPKVSRTHTSSPTIVSSVPPNAQLNDSKQPPIPPPLPTPPAQADGPSANRVNTPPPPRVSSPRPKANKKMKKGADIPKLPAGLLDGAVPPINVLLVEDNIINLKLLEAFMKRLKVRWQTAMNGKEAVKKWRNGGFHLVLMDIQLPVMNGLEATKEIRRLERVNSIGVFSSTASSTVDEKPKALITSDEVDPKEQVKGDDLLASLALFKSPVIIVALTASSLQSDRHEALAAGCNDFLTKPVNFLWLERKVMEWGCMQALIDFDGWRKWRELSQTEDASKLPPKPNHASKSSISGPVKSMGPSKGAGGKGRKEKRDTNSGSGSTTGTGGTGTSNEVDGGAAAQKAITAGGS